MHIGLVTIEYPPIIGGVGQSVQRIARGLANFGCKVDVIVLPDNHENISSHSCSGHNYAIDNSVHITYLHPVNKRSNNDPNDPSSDTACFEWLCDFARERRVDLLQSFYVSHTGFLTGLAARECGLPFLASVRGNDIHQNLFNSKRFEYIRWTLENADMLTFVSSSLQERAAQISKLKGPSRVIWNSVNPTDFVFPMRKIARFVDLKHPVIASAGEFRQKKGIERLIAACERLPEPVTLLLIGDFNWAERHYWSEEILPNVSPKVKVVVTGFVPHSSILKYFSLADIVVFPSIHDGCPNTFLEAMLAARPIICTRVGAMGDILDQSRGGVTIDPYTLDKLTQTITNLIGNQPVRRLLGKQGRDYVRKHLTLETEINSWIDCYQSLLETK